MFCYQCEQTAGGKACAGSVGVCGKKDESANLQDKITGALVNLSRVALAKPESVTEQTDWLMLEGLFTTVTNVSFNPATEKMLIEKIHQETLRLADGCDCGTAPDYDSETLWQPMPTMLLSLAIPTSVFPSAFTKHWWPWPTKTPWIHSSPFA